MGGAQNWFEKNSENYSSSRPSTRTMAVLLVCDGGCDATTRLGFIAYLATKQHTPAKSEPKAPPKGALATGARVAGQCRWLGHLPPGGQSPDPGCTAVLNMMPNRMTLA